jgi:hypothetical protein
LQVIITDGCLHDYQETKNVLVKMSKLPVSIIIVGLGDADFKNLEVLDADKDVLCNAHGEPAIRDIVQFVEYKNFEEMSAVAVTEELLAEIPD